MSNDQPGTGSILRRFAPMIYGPTTLFALGEGAVIPLFPVLAQQLGASIAVSSLVVAALVVGQLIGNLPAGWAVARFGERVTMIVSGILAFGGVILLALADNVAMLMASALVIGFCASAFALARHAFMTTRVPAGFRARALALLGGSFRLGMFIGPFVAAALLALTGDVHSSIWFFAVCLVAVVLVVSFGPDPEKAVAEPHVETQPADTGEPVTGPIALPGAKRKPVGVFRTMWAHRNVLSRLGAAAATLAAVRSARQAVLPLWGVSIGLDAQTIALIIGISGAIDFALFYASGQVMDRFGRLWAVAPAMLLMGVGMIALSFTHELPTAAIMYAAFAMVIGVGNGLSSGILLTLGADLAPQDEPAAFLGSWRTLTDGGGAIAPLLISAITAVSSLAVATGVMGLVALLGVAGFVRWIPRFVPRHKPE